MQWEQLTSTEFKKASRKTDVCIVPFGVLEKHGEHLPLGTDVYHSHKIASLAAEREPAVVFPQFYFGQIFEARCFPGTIAIEPTLLLKLVLGVLDEIGRNGFSKIILVNGHGGNEHFLPFVIQTCLNQEKPYHLYMPPILHMTEANSIKAKKLFEETDHAGACETSIMMGTNPERVNMKKAGGQSGKSLNRLHQLLPTRTSVNWYACYPEHYMGDARDADPAKGKAYVELLVDSLAQYIKLVKADKVVARLHKEFFGRVEKVAKKK